MQNHPKQAHPIPKDAIVIEMVSRLGADAREAFEERAAIIEYDGQVPRAHAECLALLEVLRRSNASAVTSLVVLQIELDGGTEWLRRHRMAADHRPRLRPCVSRRHRGQ